VREFVDACREYGLKIGFYSSLMDWHHPDGWRCAFDTAARQRFNAYITELNRELLTNYGKIDILWYDVARPMDNWEGWDSLERNQMVRELQPGIIIDNRSMLDEDFGTPEEHLTAMDHDWEACMTFNGISWGYVDSAQAGSYSYNAQRIIRMLNTVTSGGGNLLLNIGPTADGRIPVEMQERLAYLGQWLAVNGEAVYGTRTFRDGAQWSAGRRQQVDTSTNYRAQYDVEMLTLHPAPGDARKEILFTRSGTTLYAILPLRPSGTIVVRDLKLAKGTNIALLGSAHSKLAWSRRGGDVSIQMPTLVDGALPSSGPLVVRIEGIAAN